MAPVAAVVLAILLGVSACGGSDSGSGPASSAALTLAGTNPLTVRGSGFLPGESVRLELGSGATTRARATEQGSFRASFAAPVTRCDRVRVIAIGSKGSRVVLKRLPAPACLPMREK